MSDDTSASQGTSTGEGTSASQDTTDQDAVKHHLQSVPEPTSTGPSRRDWPLWEVFVRPRRGLSHGHVGSLHAPDAEMAVRNARDLYTRRGEGVSIWVVPSAQITASSPDEKDAFFDPAADKVYRHPTFYEIPDEVQHL